MFHLEFRSLVRIMCASFVMLAVCTTTIFAEEIFKNQISLNTRTFSGGDFSGNNEKRGTKVNIGASYARNLFDKFWLNTEIHIFIEDYSNEVDFITGPLINFSKKVQSSFYLYYGIGFKNYNNNFNSFSRFFITNHFEVGKRFKLVPHLSYSPSLELNLIFKRRIKNTIDYKINFLKFDFLF